ncbi:MAG: hypothetical protein L0H53_14415 [Candidatus Nitrosocosmicus sp.]|nr:hypothetical protein [Candidatus Nitrosocosmicus sp.]
MTFQKTTDLWTGINMPRKNITISLGDQEVQDACKDRGEVYVPLVILGTMVAVD